MITSNYNYNTLKENKNILKMNFNILNKNKNKIQYIQSPKPSRANGSSVNGRAIL